MSSRPKQANPAGFIKENSSTRGSLGQQCCGPSHSAILGVLAEPEESQNRENHDDHADQPEYLFMGRDAAALGYVAFTKIEAAHMPRKAAERGPSVGPQKGWIPAFVI